MSLDLREVTHEEFFAAIGQTDAHPSILPGSYPYTSAFLTRQGGHYMGREIGRIVGTGDYTGDGDKDSRYYLTA